MHFMFSAVYRVTQKDFYARPHMLMCDLRHNSDNDDLELITPHMHVARVWISFRYLSATTDAHLEVYGRT